MIFTIILAFVLVPIIVDVLAYLIYQTIMNIFRNIQLLLYVIYQTIMSIFRSIQLLLYVIYQTIMSIFRGIQWLSCLNPYFVLLTVMCISLCAIYYHEINYMINLIKNTQLILAQITDNYCVEATDLFGETQYVICKKQEKNIL